MTALLQAIGAIVTWLIAQVGLKVGFRLTVGTALVAGYIAGFAAAYVALKVIMQTASSHFGVPPLAAAAFSFFPSPTAVGVCVSMIVGTEVVLANLKIFLTTMQTSREMAGG